MRPDDLVAVADQPVRAEIPVRHPSLGVEHEDGVIGHTLHQQPESLLASPERLGFATSSFCREPVVHGRSKPHDKDDNRGTGDQEREGRLSHRAVCCAAKDGIRGNEGGALHGCVVHPGNRHAHDGSRRYALEHARHVKSEA